METREEAVGLISGVCSALEARGVECYYDPLRAAMVFSEDSGGLYVFVGPHRGRWSLRVNVPDKPQPKSFFKLSDQDRAIDFVMKNRARMIKIEAEEEAAEAASSKQAAKARAAYVPPKPKEGPLPNELDGFKVQKGWRTDLVDPDDPMKIFEGLEGRGARCTCGKIVKSAHNLPFFKTRLSDYDSFYCGCRGWD